MSGLSLPPPPPGATRRRHLTLIARCLPAAALQSGMWRSASGRPRVAFACKGFSALSKHVFFRFLLTIFQQIESFNVHFSDPAKAARGSW